MYQIKEMFYSLQGEGAQAGRPAIFCRFAGCNLWSGRESDRSQAICNFCDTDFVGTNGQRGGKFTHAQALSQAIFELWPSPEVPPYVIFTGGEPLLQLDTDLIKACKALGCELAIETNGTLPLPEGLDWVCLSPKGTARPIIQHCHELKLVYPQADARPEDFAHIQAQFRFLSPKNPPQLKTLIQVDSDAFRACIDYCLANPGWRLTLQTHKLLGID